MDAKTTSRRQARRDAMVVLYQHDITGAPLAELYNNLEKETGHQPAPFTRLETEGVMDSRDEIDAVIDEASQNWPAHRMAALERNILRIGVYEMRQRPDIPPEVSIEEAVQLAKRFCSREAAKLVNGILGKMMQEGRSGAEQAGEPG